MKPLELAHKFCRDYGLEIPILMAPMAGACPTRLAAAVSNAGGMGACGALLMKPERISSWAEDFKALSNGAFMLNNWIPDPSPIRDGEHEQRLCVFLREFGPETLPEAADAPPLSFAEQCEAMLAARPQVISSIMGLYAPAYIAQMKQLGIRWFATVTSVSEALKAEEAGADALVVQGAEAGGHRGNFISNYDQASGLMALLPIVCDAVVVPVIAAGGISDSRGVSAALVLGASAVQMGTGLLRTPEAAIPSAWADAIKQTRPEDTVVTASFSGKPGRAIRNPYIMAAHDTAKPAPAPYPVQRALTNAMRNKATMDNNINCMQAWSGQAASLSKDDAAQAVVTQIWTEVEALLG